MADDPRTRYWQEADANIRTANGLSLEDPGFWAHILVAIANATMACVPAELIYDVTTRRQATQKKVQKAIKKDLEK